MSTDYRRLAAEAIGEAFTDAGVDVHGGELGAMAEALLKAHLIDIRGLVEEPCAECEHARDDHEDGVSVCCVESCICLEWWAA